MTTLAFAQSRPWRRWYGLNVWKRRRARHLAAYPLCAMHLGQGQVVAATVADHVEPHGGDWFEFVNGRLQSLCEQCHNKHKQSEQHLGYSLAIGPDGWPLDHRHPAHTGA